MQISNNPKIQHLRTSQHKLNCFIIQHPIYCYLQSNNPKTLLIADNTNHIYQFMYPHSGIQLQHIHNGQIQNNNELSIQIDDLSNHNVLDVRQDNKCKQQQSMYIDVSMRMDVEVAVRKCAIHYLPINNNNTIANNLNKQHIQLLVVIGQNGQAKLWWKSMSKQYKIIFIQYKNQIKKISDYHLHISNNNTYISLLQHIQNHSIAIHKCIINPYFNKQQIVISIKQIQQPKFINIPTSLQHHIINNNQKYAQFVDKGRLILYNNLLLGIHQYYTIQLQVQQNNQKIQFIQFNNNLITYATSKMLYVFNRNTKVIEKGKNIAQICGLWLLDNSQCFVCMTTNPVQLHVYNIKLHLLWSIPLSTIQQPFPIQFSYNTSFQQNLQIIVLDSVTMKTHMINPQTILTSYPNFFNKTQQQKLHQSTTTTLKHRLQILKTLKNYIITKSQIKNDYNSIFRYLQNCNIHGVLCDSLRMIDNRINNDIIQNNSTIQYQHQQRILKFAYNLLNQSKYQTHIQTGLQVLLNSCNRLRKYLPTSAPSPHNNPTNNTKIWKDCIKVLSQITQNKKIKKLQQQDKNKKLFQLTYQLVHTINSHILRYQNKC